MMEPIEYFPRDVKRSDKGVKIPIPIYVNRQIRTSETDKQSKFYQSRSKNEFAYFNQKILGELFGIKRPQFVKSTILDQMPQDEVEEKHLQDALNAPALKPTDIPVPDNIIEIDENIYNKMYPKVPMRLLKSRIVTSPDVADQDFDYDVDQCDIAWIEKQPTEWRPTVDNFEKAIVFLEMNCKRKVLTLNNLLDGSSGLKLGYHECEAIFDYWLNKRLTTKRNFIPQLKRESNCKKSKKSLNDPYLVFRKDQRFHMHTRKNRKSNYDDYMALLWHRRQLSAKVESYKELNLKELNRHAMLRDNFMLFIAEYEGKNVTRASPKPKLPEMVEKFNPKEDSEHESDEDEEEYFEFQPQKGCKYLMPVSTNGFWCEESSQAAKEQKFNEVSSGFIRQRMGRGGRLMIDRRFANRTKIFKPEYRQIKIRPRVMCNKVSANIPFPVNESFTLSNSSDVATRKPESYNFVKFEFVSTN